MMCASRRLAIALLVLGVAAPARGNVVMDWYDAAVAAGYKAAVLPPIHTRNMALVAVAMFDAVNTITPRYAPYRAQSPANPGSSPDAAAAAAAHYLLVRMYPEQAREFDSLFRAMLARIPDGARAAGVQLGEHVAASLLEERKTDGADAPNVYRPLTTPGAYVPTVLPLAPWWGSLKPFVMKTGDQFRPAPPYALTSAQWATDYNEVRRMGRKVGSERSPEQTDIARFWEFVGPGTFSPMVRQLSEAKRLDTLDAARLYALVTITAADAMIAVLDAKYKYAFWRPVTAIRNGDIDGNDATEREPAWEPFIATPMHPEYPCAHCIMQSAVATVVQEVLGNDLPSFSLTSPTAPGVTRRYAHLSDYVTEVINARIYDGVHYRTSGEVGASMGQKIASYAVQTALRPLTSSPPR
jgi:hypothetical protein